MWYIMKANEQNKEITRYWEHNSGFQRGREEN